MFLKGTIALTNIISAQVFLQTMFSDALDISKYTEHNT